jgi:oxidase EvaA
MKIYQKEFEKVKNEYFSFLKKKKIFKKKNIFFYENTIEKTKNWTNIDFKKTIKWYDKIRKLNRAKVTNIHLEKMKNWTYNKKKGVLYHNSGEFFHIEGKRITNSDREVKSWDQPFIKQVGYNGGIIGLVRSNINGIPHYLIDAKYEPGNYNQIQISPSLQATYSNLNRVHLGQKPKVVKKYFSKNFKTIRKFWVTEDGGRLYLKRNLHWIIQYNGKKNIPGKTYRWMTLWELDKFIKMGHYVGPHLRSILSLI